MNIDINTFIERHDTGDCIVLSFDNFKYLIKTYIPDDLSEPKFEVRRIYDVDDDYTHTVYSTSDSLHAAIEKCHAYIKGNIKDHLLNHYGVKI